MCAVERSGMERGLGAGSRRAPAAPGCARTSFKDSTPGQRCWQRRFRGGKDGQGTNVGFGPLKEPSYEGLGVLTGHACTL